ncbi:acyltransferase family protein [Agrobacterium sp.]|uniref:acyltransferase family protein n=1 Tax=Agrobacterium sp. TaxID=361 RepID=UPI0028A8E11A|nr:acyltransferase family protein [Agrobacterium sp.]
MILFKAEENNSYRPDIDGLRAIAVTAVVIFHAGVNASSGGFVGVDVFFVLSGYLITGHIYSEVRAGRFTYKFFYVRRFKRILPALLVVLLISTALAALILSPSEMKGYSISAASAVLGVSNFYFWLSANYFSPSTDHIPMLMTWSLAVEEQFYLIFPIILIALFRFARQRLLAAIVCISVVSLLLSILGVQLYPSLTFYMLPTRAWELGAGAILAIAQAQGFSMLNYRRGVREFTSAIGMALILVPIFIYSTDTIFPGAAALPSVVGTAMVIATRVSITNKILSFKPAVFLGKISYSWYLWHWPLLVFARVSSPDEIPQHYLLLNVSVSLLLAMVSYRFVEQPFRKTKVTETRVLLTYGTAAAVVAAIVVLPALFNGFPGRVSSSVYELESSINQREPCLVSYGSTAPSMSLSCVPQNGTSEIALIGDSHAAALAPGLRLLAARDGFNITVMTKSSCPPMVSVTRFMPNHPKHDQECAAFNQSVFDVIENNSDIKTVILAGYWAAPLVEANSGSRYVDSILPDADAPIESNRLMLQRGLADQIERITKLGRKVIVLQDVPLFDKNPVSIALRDALPLRSLIASLSHPVENDKFTLPASVRFEKELSSARSVVSEVAAAQTQSIELIDPYNTLCVAERCEHRSGEGVLYIDKQHLSLAGSAKLAKEILNASNFKQSAARSAP